MRCSKAQEYLSLEQDGMLPPGATVQLSEHLDSCAGCREYREDLLLGRRFLQATEPELPDNFDWKLQLRLNQALKEAAGEVAYPWEEDTGGRWTWVRNFGTAAAVGMAAVLALAIVMGPSLNLVPQTYDGAPTMFAGKNTSSPGGDRLPLERSLDFGRGFSRTVSGSPGLNKNTAQGPVLLQQGWSGRDLRDLKTINSLRQDNQFLNRRLRDVQKENDLLRTKLDTSRAASLDLGEE